MITDEQIAELEESAKLARPYDTWLDMNNERTQNNIAFFLLAHKLVPSLIEEYKKQQLELEYLKSNNKRLMWLEALEQAGVDNWQGIDEAYELFDEWCQDD